MAFHRVVDWMKNFKLVIISTVTLLKNMSMLPRDRTSNNVKPLQTKLLQTSCTGKLRNAYLNNILCTRNIVKL